jgi:hypothetical protein
MNHSPSWVGPSVWCGADRWRDCGNAISFDFPGFYLVLLSSIVQSNGLCAIYYVTMQNGYHQRLHLRGYKSDSHSLKRRSQMIVCDSEQNVVEL